MYEVTAQLGDGSYGQLTLAFFGDEHAIRSASRLIGSYYQAGVKWLRITRKVAGGKTFVVHES